MKESDMLDVLKIDIFHANSVLSQMIRRRQNDNLDLKKLYDLLDLITRAKIIIEDFYD